MNTDERNFNRDNRRLNIMLAVALAALAYVAFNTPASARDLAYMPNQAGGEIVLTDGTPKACDGARLAYSRSEDGSIISGCWAAGENYVVIKWIATGSIKLFRYSQFTPFEAEEAKPAAAHNPDFKL